MTVTDLPGANATLHAISAILLVAGAILIKRKNVVAHRAGMIAAFACSILFVASYLYYHGRVGSVKFPGTGWVRPAYFAGLITHVGLAGTVPPLAIVTLWRAARGNFERHRRLARVTLPIWLYVSITSVIVYWMLYRIAWGAPTT